MHFAHKFPMNRTDEHFIEVIDAYEHNLKHIDVKIPKGKLVVFTGVSGSGKSSLAFGILATESAREWQNSYPLYLRNKMPHYERPKVGVVHHLTPSIVVDQKTIGGGSRSTVGTAIDVAPLIRLLFSRIGEPSAGGSMAYSFNHPEGMCHECTGLGFRTMLIEDKMFEPQKTLKDGGIRFSQFASGWQRIFYQNNPLLPTDKKLKDFTEDEWRILRYGSPQPLAIELRSNNTGETFKMAYEGVIPRFRRLYLKRDISKLKKSLQEEILSLTEKGICTTCNGTGLNPKALASRINGYGITDYVDMPTERLLKVLQNIKGARGCSLAQQITPYLERMITVGIGYLSLSRRTDTLSGGESQRIKMVRNLGSSLSGITYILDEPTAGLHPYDAERIGKLLLDLRDKGNNVLVVEHSRQMIALADHIIELGPMAGTQGGELVYAGNLKEFLTRETVTAKAMKQTVTINPNPFPWTECYEIHDAHHNNLKHLNLTLPKGILIAITGVAGSGKSSLACFEIPKQCPNAVIIDQKPIGTSVRSTPATYTGVMDEIRNVFAQYHHVDPSWFSFNAKGGCSTCKGTGRIIYDMAFAEAVSVKCENCGGHRYNSTALGYVYKGQNIENVMELTIEEAQTFFDSPKIQNGLQILCDIGLGYLTLGQPTSTLSGGEIQRIKLAGELNKKGNIYILDEPTVGLHYHDVGLLLKLFRQLVKNGNTVIIVEHRLEVAAQVDWVIDMGPEGGERGGEILFSGTPRDLLQCSRSKTAAYLKGTTRKR